MSSFPSQTLSFGRLWSASHQCPPPGVAGSPLLLGDFRLLLPLAGRGKRQWRKEWEGELQEGRRKPSRRYSLGPRTGPSDQPNLKRPQGLNQKLGSVGWSPLTGLLATTPGQVLSPIPGKSRKKQEKGKSRTETLLWSCLASRTPPTSA